MQVSAETRVSAVAHAAVRPLDDRAVVVDLKTGQFWELNAVGAAIWNLLMAGRSVQETATEVTIRFNIDSSTSMTDTLEFVNSLLGQGLVTVAETATRPNR